MIANKCRKGFTIAEVLITLTIIGVVATLTLPALKNNADKIAMEKQTLKTYSTLQDMLARYGVDNETTDISAFFDDHNNVKKYLTISGSCSKAEDCFADTYSKISGEANIPLKSLVQNGDSIYLLNDGSVLAIRSQGQRATD